jgi:L-asparagine transporter-like permease
MPRQFPGTAEEWNAMLVVALVIGLAVVGSAFIDSRRGRNETRRRVRSRLRGFVRRPGGWQEWDG